MWNSCSDLPNFPKGRSYSTSFTDTLSVPEVVYQILGRHYPNSKIFERCKFFSYSNRPFSMMVLLPQIHSPACYMSKEYRVPHLILLEIFDPLCTIDVLECVYSSACLMLSTSLENTDSSCTNPPSFVKASSWDCVTKLARLRQLKCFYLQAFTSSSENVASPNSFTSSAMT